MNERSAVMKAIDEMIDKGARKSLGVPDSWIYEDVDWCDEFRWNAFMATIGNEEAKILAVSRKNGRVRAQAFWNPIALHRKRAFFTSAGSA